MKAIILLTLGVLFRILQVYLNHAATEVETALINHLLPVAMGGIINLNISPSELFRRRFCSYKIYTNEMLMPHCQF